MGYLNITFSSTLLKRSLNDRWKISRKIALIESDKRSPRSENILFTISTLLTHAGIRHKTLHTDSPYFLKKLERFTVLLTTDSDDNIRESDISSLLRLLQITIVDCSDLLSALGLGSVSNDVKGFDVFLASQYARQELRKRINKAIDGKTDELKSELPQRKRVLFVNIFFPPFCFGGATVVVANLIEQLKSKYEVFGFAGFLKKRTRNLHAIDYMHKEILVRTVNIDSFLNNDHTKNYKNPKIKKIFKEYLKLVTPDVIHFHSMQGLSASLLEAAFELRIKFFVTVHDFWWLSHKQFLQTNIQESDFIIDANTSSRYRPKKWIDQRTRFLLGLLKKSEKIIVPSQTMKSALIKFGLPEESVVLNANGVSPSRFQIGQKVVRFGFMGGTNEHKGYSTVIKAFSRVKSKNYILNIYCPESEIDYELMTDDLPTDLNVRYFSAYKWQDTDLVYQDLDVIIIAANVLESYSLVAREALIRKIPVISSKSGGPEEVIENGVNGFLYSMDDYEQLADKIEKCCDINELNRIVENIDSAKIVTVSNQASELESILFNWKEWNA